VPRNDLVLGYKRFLLSRKKKCEFQPLVLLLFLLIPACLRLMQIGVRKPRVNWPLPEWDTAIAPRHGAPCVRESYR